MSVGAGTLIAGRYELIELIGKGGMGSVWRARQLNLDRELALKLLEPEEFESSSEARRRFAREAHVASAIKHPNVIEIYDVGEHRGLTYLAMELLEGLSLRDRISGEERLSIEFVIDVGEALAEALVAAHALGAVHRDLKPENIFLELAGQTLRVVVLDFGLAFIDKHEKLGRMTQHGVVMGTPHYLSPEQARGLEVGAPTDIYSLGCVIYELLTGNPPFLGSPLNVMSQHLYVAPQLTSDLRPQVPRELDELITAMLSKRPEQRPGILEVREQFALLASTLSGRRQRGRGATYLEDRAERMISFSPTAPLPQPATRSSAVLLGADNIDLHVAYIGELSDDIDLGLLSNDIGIAPWTGASEGIELLLVTESDPERLLAEAEAAIATGLPVVVAAPSSDRLVMGALARLGATELTASPLAIDSLVRAIRRAKRRHDRRRRGRRESDT